MSNPLFPFHSSDDFFPWNRLAITSLGIISKISFSTKQKKYVIIFLLDGSEESLFKSTNSSVLPVVDFVKNISISFFSFLDGSSCGRCIPFLKASLENPLSSIPVLANAGGVVSVDRR